MTTCDRLVSILSQGAVLSLSERQRREVSESEYEHYWGAPGRKNELSDYVCCAFMPPWGMCKQHKEEFAILVLDAEPLCTRDGTLFCPINSAKSEYSVEEIRRMTEIEAFGACFPNALTNQAYPGAEILIQDAVPLYHVEALVFCDQEAHDYWMPKVRGTQVPDHVASRMRSPVVKVRSFPGFRFPNDYVVERRVRE